MDPYKLAQFMQSHGITVTLLYEEDKEKGGYFYGSAEFPNGDRCTAISNTLSSVFTKLVISIKDIISSKLNSQGSSHDS